MMRKKNMQVLERYFPCRNSIILFRLACLFCSLSASAQLFVGEDTRIIISGQARLYTEDPSNDGPIQIETSKVYVHQGTIISGGFSNDIAYIGKTEKKEKTRHKLFAATRKEKVEKPVETSSRPEQKKPTVSYGAANRRTLGICISTSDPIIIPANNSYKAAAVALEGLKKNNTIPQSKDRITYTSFVRIAAACYIFYALRGPPLSYLKS
jgi:hypothetical protein